MQHPLEFFRDLLVANGTVPEGTHLLDLALKGTILLSVVWTMACLSRRASAAQRHFVWSAGMLGLLLLPVFSLLLPEWKAMPRLPDFGERMTSRTRISSEARALEKRDDATQRDSREQPSSRSLTENDEPVLAQERVDQEEGIDRAGGIADPRGGRPAWRSGEGGSNAPLGHRFYSGGKGRGDSDPYLGSDAGVPSQRGKSAGTTQARFTLGDWLALTWLGGVAICLLPLVLGRIRLARRFR